MPALERTDDVFVLSLGDDENRFNPDWIAQVDGMLDEVEAAEPPRALVTSAGGKFWSNGLDLDWVAANPGQLDPYLLSVHELLARVLCLPVPTVAALQGHVFAGGAMLAVAHDFRVMRSDRGFFCFPEVDLAIPFTPGMSALIQARLSKKTAHEAMTTGRRYGGTQALEAGIVDAVADEAAVLETALELAQPLASKQPVALGTIKTRMYADALAALRDASANTFGGA